MCTTLKLYTDASVDPSGQSSLAYVVVDGDKIINSQLMTCPLSTSVRMEMWAVIFGLGRIPKKKKLKIKIYTDLKYIVNGFENIDDKIKNSRTNQDLWYRLKKNSEGFISSECLWIKSKSGNIYHHLADQIAFEGKNLDKGYFIDSEYEKMSKK